MGARPKWTKWGYNSGIPFSGIFQQIDKNNSFKEISV